MKFMFSPWVILAASAITSPAQSGQRFEQHITLKRFASDQEFLPGIRITVMESGTGLTAIQPGETDENGKATIRFRSTDPEPRFHFKILNQESVEPKYYAYLHGIYPEPPAPVDQDTPYIYKNAVEHLTAVVEEQLAMLPLDSLQHGRTSLFSRMAAGELLLPTSDSTIADLPDPEALAEHLALKMSISVADAGHHITRWKQQVGAAGESASLDERALVSIADGHMDESVQLANEADALSGQDKTRFLKVMPDTGRIATTVAQLNRVITAQPDSVVSPADQNAARQNLAKIQSAVPVRARPRISSPDQINAGIIGKFSRFSKKANVAPSR